MRAGEVVDAGRAGESAVTLVLADGARETARRVLLATGMDYRHPELPGIRERWGRSVFHCPFCHGWENRERPLGVLDRGADGARRAVLLRAWSDDVTLLSDGPAGLDAADARRLATLGVEVDERPVTELARAAGKDPLDFFFDLPLDTPLIAKLFQSNDAGVAPLLQHDAGVLALSDAGAHLIFLCDAASCRRPVPWHFLRPVPDTP